MMSHCTMMGRLTRDPEIRQTKGNEPKTVAKFGLAVERDYAVQGEKVTDFFEIEAWQKTAEFVEKYLKKGQLVALVGALRRSEWTKPETGEKRFSYYYRGEEYLLRGGQKKRAGKCRWGGSPGGQQPRARRV